MLILWTVSDVGAFAAVGLVVEDCQVSAIVPGGPLDKDFRGVTVQAGDVVVMVDHQTVDSETLLSVCRTLPPHRFGYFSLQSNFI